ncbi:MAG: hypothetical protein O2856_02770 [Planctomycetota bacterium]|nr:hypothetical protein [Planctomycetota bacterium]
MSQNDRGLIEAFVGDGRSLIGLCGICLGLAGLFAIFQSITGHFLPHDVAYLQMQPEALCRINECRIVHFMIHDRISFGGSLVAIAVLYLWMAEFPVRNGEGWAWWTLVVSGFAGFGSFLTYLGYGYLDTWHGAATLLLLPIFVWGLWKQRPKPGRLPRKSIRFSILLPMHMHRWKGAAAFGRILMLGAACGMIGAGLTIQFIGMTSVFVPTDLTFMGIDREQLQAINPRLIPLIAHDRAGFGGAVTTVGILTLACVWFGQPSRSLWQTLAVGGFVGWSTAVLVHPAIGYTDPIHLAPAVAGATCFAAGLFFTRRTMFSRDGNQA